MPYTVQFVGLVCFYREKGARIALLPDGREPGPGIDRHYGSIVVAPEAIEEASGWAASDLPRGGTFTLSPCEILLEGAGDAGDLDTSEHDNLLPQLRQIAPDFEIDPARAKTVAKIRIRQGKLVAKSIPGGSAAISELEVPHDGPIRITVKSDDGSAERSIVVKPGTEIAITNMARGVYDNPDAQDGNHFRIYEKLSVRPVTLREPRSMAALPKSTSRHPMFSRTGPIGLYASCSNTGCC